MTAGFGVLDGPAANLNGSGLRVQATGAGTLRTRLAIAENFQLGFQGLLDGPFDDSLAHLDGQGFNGIEVDVESRPFVSKGPTGNNFPPSEGHVRKLDKSSG